VQDVMTDFWSNLFFVTVPLKRTFVHQVAFKEAIKEHALGSFTDLLKAAVLHPAMLCYLDNAKSTKVAPNENLGRELLELHTVGRPAGYEEADVKASTRILTGYRVLGTGTCEAFYSTVDHDTNPVSVLGFSAVNDRSDGRPVTSDYLDYLATHAATARRLATRLAVRFVSDAPSQGLIDELTTVFTSSGTNITATLRALVAHPEFAASSRLKVRTPIEDLVNTFRVLQIDINPPPEGDEGFAANALPHVAGAMGQKPYAWPRPDGFPDFGEAWVSPSRMLGSWRVHKNAIGGVYDGAGYKNADYWLGPLPARFDDIVDRICRMVLGIPMSTMLLDTACIAVDRRPPQIITEGSPVATYRFTQLLLALLDNPDHMTR
jgi:uncharacterized protein (DUF1800 family)